MPTRKAVSILVVSNTLVMLTKLVIYHFNPAVGSRGQRGQRRARAIFSAHSATRARTFDIRRGGGQGASTAGSAPGSSWRLKIGRKARETCFYRECVSGTKVTRPPGRSMEQCRCRKRRAGGGCLQCSLRRASRWPLPVRGKELCLSSASRTAWPEEELQARGGACKTPVTTD